MANAIPPGLPAESWEDRLREGSYAAPSGRRLAFQFEDVSREVTLRGTVWEFPGVEGGYVQRKGFGPRRYPLNCYFSGRNHDQQATAFEALLLEHGTGRLQHPMYGPVNVTPFGDIVRRDDLVRQANQTVIEVTFFTTIGALYPSTDKLTQNEILSAIDDFDAIAAQQFADSMSLSNSLTQAASKATLRSMLLGVGDALDSISSSVTSVNEEFRDLQSVVNLGLDTFIGKPLLLARQISNLIKAPARALTGIGTRLNAYGDLARSIFGSDGGDPASRVANSQTQLRAIKIANDFHAADLFASTAMIAAVQAAIANPIGADGKTVPAASTGTSQGGNFTTRPQAIAAAAGLLEQMDELVIWRDRGFDALSQLQAPNMAGQQVDRGGSYQALTDIVASAAGFLVDVSFSLAPERQIVTDRRRTILDLAAQLHGRIDDETLNLLINSNELTGSQILELEAGTRISYFPPS